MERAPEQDLEVTDAAAPQATKEPTVQVSIILNMQVLLHLSRLAKLLLLTAAGRRGSWISVMENDPLGSFMCQNRNNSCSVQISFVRFQRLIHKLQTFVI